jgi:predicted RNase H-like HicB family nuclease
MDQPKYHIDIFWSDEDGGYIANVPDLRYCSAFGESYEEALREVLVAMDLHLDTMRGLNRPIPEPGARRVIGVRTDVSESGDTIQIIGRAAVSAEEEVSEVADRVTDAVSRIAEDVAGSAAEARGDAEGVAFDIEDTGKELNSTSERERPGRRSEH